MDLSRACAARGARLALCAGLVAGALLAPTLYGLVRRVFEGRLISPPTFWRSSPAGVDLLAFVLPNPNHPLAPRAWFELFANPFAALEHVASLPLIALCVLLWAYRRGWRPGRPWSALGVTFALLALGPFVRVAGLMTYVPGPWALLRYVPVLEWARTPARFAVMVVLVVAVLFAGAVRTLAETVPQRRRLLLTAVGFLVLFELLPIPRRLALAQPPTIYDRIAADRRAGIRVLELPFGISDGASSVGRYTARAQLYQTVHGKPLVGGGLSRVSRQRVDAVLSFPVLRALAELSANPDAAVDVESIVPLGADFARDAGIAYVVVDTSRASPQLITFAKRVFHLEYLAADRELELYQPAQGSRSQ
jgi:hypothetical protein